MDVDTLLRRQIELHGTLRHQPRTPTELKDVYRIMKELVLFFRLLRSSATRINTSPESVFQCLMHIGACNVVSFDKQRRDGAVPMHQAKVLARTNAVELKPHLQSAIAASQLDDMVALCKTTRAFLRIKVEDCNDFNTAELFLREAVEYLDFINTASVNDFEVMFNFYMVEDEASLLSLLGRDTRTGLCESFEETRAMQLTFPLLSETKLRDEVQRLAYISSLSTESVKNRLNALQAINSWMGLMNEKQYLEHIFCWTAHLLDPLSVCLGEKRSTICRQACMVVLTIARRTPAEFFSRDSLSLVLCKWSTVLLRGVFVTVSAIAQATDAALRALIFASTGNVALIKNILGTLESRTHPELRRRCLGYLALAVVLSRGGVCVTLLQLDAVAIKFMEIGDAACRGMARALCISITHFIGASKMVKNRRSEFLLRQETEKLLVVLDDVFAFEAAIFGDGVGGSLFLSSDTEGTISATRMTAENLRETTLPAVVDVYDTAATLFFPSCESMCAETKIPQQPLPNTFDSECDGNLISPQLCR